MMRHLAAIAFLMSTYTAHAVPSDQLDQQHPLFGKWTWTRSVNNCTETYDFRSNGIKYVTSGEERTEATYYVSDQPDAKGFYVLTDKITKDYGGKDCGDDLTDSTGEEATIYVRFHKSGNMILMCFSESLNKCFGPLKRVK